MNAVKELELFELGRVSEETKGSSGLTNEDDVNFPKKP